MRPKKAATSNYFEMTANDLMAIISQNSWNNAIDKVGFVCYNGIRYTEFKSLGLMEKSTRLGLFPCLPQ
jgi:hypothetical protein